MLRLRYLILILLLPTLCLAADATNRHRTLPSSTVSPNTFNSDNQNFLQFEDADRYVDMFQPYIIPGTGIHATSGSMTSATFATRGYTSDGLYVNQVAAAINYAAVGCATSDTAWVALNSALVGNIGNFARVTSTHYIVNCVDTTQPLTPTNSALMLQVTITTSALATVKDIANHTPVSSTVAAMLGYINVRDFGADPDDPGDDTAAILAALATVPSIPGTQGGQGCLYFPLPKTVGGFYKVSSTLDFTGRFNSCMIAPGKYSADQHDDLITHTALFHWYGSTGQNVILLHDTQSMIMRNITVNCRNIVGTRGLALGADGAAASSVKKNEFHGIEVSHCDIGIRLGDVAANGPDVASNTFNDVFVHHNISQGISQNSGNGVANFRLLTAECNGVTPAGGRKGVNVYAEGGSFEVRGYVGIGEGACKPVDGDLYGASVGWHISSCWSEVHGPFITNGGSPRQYSRIDCKHYNATMTDTLVTRSIVWSASSPLVLGGDYFTNIEVNAGANALVIDNGVTFYSGAQHNLSVVPTFTGTAISGQLAYVGIPGTAQRGRVCIGRPCSTAIGSTFSETPGLETVGRELRTVAAFCTVDGAGDNCNTLAMQRGGDSVGAMHWVANGYFDAGGNVKSITAGNMSKLKWSGGIAASGQPVFELKYDTASAGGQTKFAPGSTLISLSHLPVGTGTAPVLTIGTQHITWASAPPTVGAWVVGDVVYNNAAMSGVPPAWMCSVAGTPGTWKPLAVIP